MFFNDSLFKKPAALSVSSESYQFTTVRVVLHKGNPNPSYHMIHDTEICESIFPFIICNKQFTVELNVPILWIIKLSGEFLFNVRKNEQKSSSRHNSAIIPEPRFEKLNKSTPLILLGHTFCTRIYKSRCER